jgi:hypothetical protein
LSQQHCSKRAKSGRIERWWRSVFVVAFVPARLIIKIKLVSHLKTSWYSRIIPGSPYLQRPHFHFLQDWTVSTALFATAPFLQSVGPTAFPAWSHFGRGALDAGNTPRGGIDDEISVGNQCEGPIIKTFRYKMPQCLTKESLDQHRRATMSGR